MRLRLFVVLAVASLVGCAMNAGQEAIDEAREDLGCEDLSVREVSAPSRRGQCDVKEFIVEGCGQTAQYRCESGGGVCDYACSRIGEDALRGS
jgi:hypothetical protein